MEPWIWSIILLAVALVVIGVELFVPSGGVLGIVASLAIIGCVVCGFLSGVKTGLVMLITVSIVVPAVIISALKWWPHTPLGQRILVPPPESEDDILPDVDLRRELKALVGHRGLAKTKMLPSGIVELEGRSYDAVGEGAAIEPGQTVKVVGVDMNRLIVRLVEGAEPVAATPAPTSGDDLLGRPIETFGLESLDNPLT